LSSGAASDPKDSKSFLSSGGKSFSKILYEFLYEAEIVTFQKILTTGGDTSVLLKVGEKRKLIIDKNSSLKLM
jgi:hypothetical protein